MSLATKDIGKDLPLLEDLYELFISGKPLLDVRAPIEFHAGAFPNTTNCPLMDDADRAAIGKRYKQQGQEAAIQLGMQRVSGAVRDTRVQAWVEFARRHPDGVLYCFRGGLRSRISQQLLFEASGIAYPRVKGGYKLMRRFLLQQLEVLPARLQPLILSGRTGAGKTRLLQTLSHTIDLEGLANHRGSAFGTQALPQPTQINFENSLAIDLLRKVHAGQTRLLFEDESRKIGSLHLPETLFKHLSQAPIVLLQVADEERVEISFQEYVIDNLAAFTALHHGDATAGFAAFSTYLQHSLDKIQQRLGGVRYQHAKQLLQQALKQHQEHGELAAYYELVRFILCDYYDPMYDYQLSKKQQRIVFQGSAAEVSEYLQSQQH